MATSGSQSVRVTDYDTLKFSWSQSSQSIENNNTTISWKMELVATAYGRISSSGTKAWNVTVNGANYSGSVNVGISNNTTKTLASGTTTISHDSDGTKTFNYSFSQSFSGITFSGVGLGTVSGSGSGTLNTIPRGSVLGAISDFTLGNAIDIPITKYSSSFTDTLTISLNGTTIKTVSGITNGYDVSFTTSELTTIYSKLPSATTGSFTFKLTTKSGSTQIGTSSKTATGTIPSSVEPSISSVTVSEGNTSVVPSSWGVYVKNKSKLKFVISASAGSGSSVSSVKTTINGSTYTGTTITTNLINTSGTLTATITVTDKRNRSTSTTKTITVVDYDVPYVTTLTAIRCDSNGNALENGTYAKVTLVGGVYSVSGKNTASYSIKYKKTTETEYKTHTFNVTTLTINSSVILSGIETNSSYNIVGVVTDYFTTINESMNPPLMSVFRTLNFLTGGKGGAVGKMAEEEDVFEIGFQTKLTGGLKPIFLEADTDLDDVLTPNFYTGRNVSTYNYANCPLTSGTFYLEVVSCGADGQIRQTITSCDKTKLITFTRFYYSGTWGNWVDNSLSYKNIVTVIGNGDTSLSTTEVTDVKMKGSVVLGAKLSNNSNGQVIIGSGVNYVKIEASLYAYSGFTNGDLVHLNILRNESTVYSVMKRIAGVYETIAGAGKVIAVSEGDVIKLCGRNQTGARGLISGSGNVTFMTVEAVG